MRNLSDYAEGEAPGKGPGEDAPSAPAPGAPAPHRAAEAHHHHTHARGSRHVAGHHLLQVEHLSVSFDLYDEDEPFFRAGKRRMNVIDDLSLSVHAGEIIAVVGASGSGKSLLADSILGLFEPNSHVTGDIWFDGALQDASSLARLRGHEIALVPQSVSALDPLMKVGAQVEGACPRRLRAARRAKREALFARYGLDASVAGLYPHELSGGMARRVLLCSALMGDPKLIVADEPTPGLDFDLSVRALSDLRDIADGGGGVLLITHDIELALSVADRVAVFRAGTVVEETSVAAFASPDTLAHPFSRALWHALPEHGLRVDGVAPAGEGGAPGEAGPSSQGDYSEPDNRPAAEAPAPEAPAADAPAAAAPAAACPAKPGDDRLC